MTGVKCFSFITKFAVYIIYIIHLVFSSSSGGDLSKRHSNGTCLRPNGLHGVCKNIKECEPLLSLLIKGKSRPQPWVIDFLIRSHCGFEGKDPVVCCPIAVESKDEQPSLNLTLTNPFYARFLNKSCGLVQTLDKVIGGSETALHEFPWMALIGYKTRYGLQFRCGGSLISPRYVLTAAHCVTGSSDIQPISVRLGEHDLRSVEDCDDKNSCHPPVQDIAIEELIPYPDYFKREFRNDIALIRMAKAVEFTDFIRPICLPIVKDLKERSLLNEKAVVAGWGAIESGVGSYVLRKVTLPIIPLSECSKIYKIYDVKVPITESQICAGGEAKGDSCKGDSGGPLQTILFRPSGEPVYVQHGIVSFGPTICGKKGIPGVYTNVSHYSEWILKNVKD